uniref:Cysteine-rich PDZ-binding protein n=1 Tax=Quercus lobata TaxID=97700 RepID=A0A7N2N735_QUELO
MVCEKCEKKLTKVIVPDKWKAGASNTTEGGGRKINENKLLSKKSRYKLKFVVTMSMASDRVRGASSNAVVYKSSCSQLTINGLHTAIQNASYASNKYTRKPSTVTPVLIRKESVQCAVSKYLTPRFTNRAMYDADQILAAFSVSAFP